MKRPVGLILAAIVLGLSAVVLLLMAALMVIAGFAMHAHPTVPAQPAFFLYVMYGVGVMYLALAAWAIVTTVGLIMLRLWARYSILVIGGCLAGLGGMSLIGVAVTVFFGHSGLMGGQPLNGMSLTPHMMHIVLGIVGAFYGSMTAIGTWWLVYFNLRSTKELFHQRDRYDLTTGLLVPRVPSRRPTAITILGVLMLLGAVSFSILAFLPLPALLFGMMLQPLGTHVFYGCFVLISALIGVGLLRLHPAARIAAIAYLLFGCINVPLSFLPSSQAQLHVYQERLLALIPKPPNGPPNAFHSSPIQVVLYCSFGLILNIVMIWLLHYYRTAFNAPPPIVEEPQAAT
jgi:hypothetical protein